MCVCICAGGGVIYCSLIHFIQVCGAWTVTMHQWAVSGPVGVLYEFNK